MHPGVYEDYGVAYQGGGIMHAVRRRPWIAPRLALSMIRTLRREARDADLVHAMWLAGGVVARGGGRACCPRMSFCGGKRCISRAPMACAGV